jgi:hypothetical protein
MLKPCGKGGCAPVEQLRGDMRPGDYYDVIASNPFGEPFPVHLAKMLGGVPEPEKYGLPVRDHGDIEVLTSQGYADYHMVEVHENNSRDFRICCKTCGKATGWTQRDVPGMPGAGADFSRKTWNESV